MPLDHPPGPRPDEGLHPDAERLAQYIDQRLDAVARANVERHLVGCAACREQVVEVAAFLRADAAPVKTAPVVPFSRPAARPRRWIPIAVGLAAAAALVLTVTLPLLRRGESRPELQALMTLLTQEQTRPLEGRLAVGLPYAPEPAQTRGAGRETPPALRIAAADVEKATAGGSAAADFAARALAAIAGDDLDGAINALERAAAAAPADARYPSDLSAVYLARGDRQGRPADVASALAAAERARALDAALPEACFNRALAMERLQPAGAREAWTACLALESDPAWQREIRTRSDRLAR